MQVSALIGEEWRGSIQEIRFRATGKKWRGEGGCLILTREVEGGGAAAMDGDMALSSPWSHRLNIRLHETS